MKFNFGDKIKFSWYGLEIYKGIFIKPKIRKNKNIDKLYGKASYVLVMTSVSKIGYSIRTIPNKFIKKVDK